MTDPIYCTLQRITTGDTGTFGTFDAPDLGFSCIALELPDRQNRPMISRIPAGYYHAAWVNSLRLKRRTYRLVNPPGRCGILIHPANFAGDKNLGWQSDLYGCIALGRAQGTLINGHHVQQAALLDSRAMTTAFEALAAGRPLIIAIIDEPPPQEPPELCDEP